MPESNTSRPDPFSLDFKPGNRNPPPRGGGAPPNEASVSQASLTGTPKPALPGDGSEPIGGESWAPWTPPESNDFPESDTPSLGDTLSDPTKETSSTPAKVGLPIGPVVAVVALAIFLPMLARK